MLTMTRRLGLCAALLCGLLLGGLASSVPRLSPIRGNLLSGFSHSPLRQGPIAGGQTGDAEGAYRGRGRQRGPREAPTDTDLSTANAEIEVLPGQTPNLSGQNTMTIQSKVGSLTQFTFRLYSQYTITSATVSGGTPVTVTSASTTTRIVRWIALTG